MFGYINIYKDELRIREFNVFKSYYCGLCKEQGNLLGALTRFGLSNDFTVLALLLDSIINDEIVLRKTVCAINPLSKKTVVKSCEAINYAAFMSVALTYYKIKDDILDNTFLKAYLIPFYFMPYKKVKKEYSEKLDKIEQSLSILNTLEKENCKDIDKVSTQFGNIMAEIFDAPMIKDTRVIKLLGYDLGRWLYIIDAIDDYEEDIKKNKYNPFSSKDEIIKSLEPLWYNLSNVAATYELLDLKRNKELIDNIIYLGIKQATYRVATKYEVKINESV